MLVFLISLIVSFFAVMLIIRLKDRHSKYSYDDDIQGIQKFHYQFVPRVGGLALIVSILISLVVQLISNWEVGKFGLTLCASSLPIFLVGFAEDLTKAIKVKWRLIAAVFSSALMGHLMGGWLQSLQIIGLDDLISSYFMFAICITCFAVAGITNAFNIIDGFNGLSSMVGFIILSAIAYVSCQVNDQAIMVCSFAMMGALLGFFVWNFPRGLIFLGDGGAYLIGFWIGALSILLTNRNPDVSKWFPFLLCIYPVFETLFTIYRRLILRRSNPSLPDASHLHQLIHHRLVKWHLGSSRIEDKLTRNSLTSPYLWALTIISVIPALLFWRYHLVLKVFTVLFAVGYFILYRSILRFAAPKWMIISNNPNQR